MCGSVGILIFFMLAVTSYTQVQILSGEDRLPNHDPVSCGFPMPIDQYPLSEWLGSAQGRIRVIAVDTYVYLGYQFKCERQEENITVARAKTGGVNDLIMCFKIETLNEDLFTLRLYTKEALRPLKSGLPTTVQYTCDRYQENRNPVSSHWSRPEIPAWDFLVFVREGTRPAKPCPRALQDIWHLDISVGREPCHQWQYLVDIKTSHKHLRFILNIQTPDILNTKGQRDFRCIYSTQGPGNLTYLILLNDDRRDTNFTCVAYTIDNVGRPAGALMRISPLDDSSCGMFPDKESLGNGGLPFTLENTCNMGKPLSSGSAATRSKNNGLYRATVFIPAIISWFLKYHSSVYYTPNPVSP